jgi:hypothetical protein
VSVSAALGYASQTAFAAAFRKLTGETPSNWRRRYVSSNRSASRSIPMADMNYPRHGIDASKNYAVFPCITYGWTVEGTAKAPATPRGKSCAARRTKSIVAGGTSGIRKALSGYA